MARRRCILPSRLRRHFGRLPVLVVFSLLHHFLRTSVIFIPNILYIHLLHCL